MQLSRGINVHIVSGAATKASKNTKFHANTAANLLSPTRRATHRYAAFMPQPT
jgi:hypothetical protein